MAKLITKNRAQAFLEYMLLVNIILASLLSMRGYLKRSLQGYFKKVSEGFVGFHIPSAAQSNLHIQVYSKNTAKGVPIESKFCGQFIPGMYKQANGEASWSETREELK